MSHGKHDRALGLTDVVAGIVLFYLFSEFLFVILGAFPGLLQHETLVEIQKSGVMFLVVWGIIGNLVFKPYLNLSFDREEKTVGYEVKTANLRREVRSLTERIDSQLEDERLQAIARRDQELSVARQKSQQLIEQELRVAEELRRNAQQEIDQLKQQASEQLALEADQLATEVVVKAIEGSDYVSA